MESRVLLRKPFLPTDVPCLSRKKAVSARGFSLVEVVLALAIVSFSLVGILSMFPVALDTAKDSKTETRVTVIAQSIFSDLRFSPATNTKVMVRQAANATEYSSTNYVATNSLTSFTSVYVAYDQEGRPLQSITGAQFSNQFTNSSAAFVASISTNTSPQAGLARVDVTIVAPPQAGSASSARKSYFFTTYLPTQ